MRLGGLLACLLGLVRSTAAEAASVSWEGYTWEVTEGSQGNGDGLRIYSASNVSIDSFGFLHLKLARVGEDWSCAEVINRQPLGYGEYHFQVESWIDRLAENVGLELVTYTPPTLGAFAWAAPPPPPRPKKATPPVAPRLSLCMQKGNAPADGKPEELVIRSFTFTPL